MKYLLFLLVCISSNVFAQVYTWVDENGNTQYSQFPPNDSQVDAEVLNIPTEPSVSVEISAEQLLGEWRCTSSDGNTFVITFNENLTLSMTLTGKIKGEMQGTWQLDGVKMHNTLSGYLEKNKQRKSIKSVKGYEIFTFVSNDSLKSLDNLGNTTKYTRITSN